jgi:hypothetical protein
MSDIAQYTDIVKEIKNTISNHHFKWWFAFSPIRAYCLRHLKGGLSSAFI